MGVISWELDFFRDSSGQSKFRTSGTHCTNISIASILFVFLERGITTGHDKWSWHLTSNWCCAVCHQLGQRWIGNSTSVLIILTRRIPCVCPTSLTWSLWKVFFLHFISPSFVMHEPNVMKLILIQVLCECFCIHPCAPISGRIFICSLLWYCAYANVMQTPEPPELASYRQVHLLQEQIKPPKVSDYLGPCPFGECASPLLCLRW